ncbi:CobW family GTP-binding protein [Roseovarius sp. C7]|uniref:CobW family GTP-binding protein n=1 Tax=Roseovarius sp. C7 TaxID=3398643 RepID=UPI0039F6D293
MVDEGAPTPIPLATVGGFLGSGKTTLINHMLAHANGRRYVIFVNDFGAINIDLQLVETIEDDRISFSNGCVCCTLNDEFVSSVAQMSKREDRPDAILIEASGVADPRALEASLSALEASNHVQLETALYILDANCFGQRDYVEAEMLIDHAATSDLLLINKTDLVSQEALARLVEEFSVSAVPVPLIWCIPVGFDWSDICLQHFCWRWLWRMELGLWVVWRLLNLVWATVVGPMR